MGLVPVIALGVTAVSAARLAGRGSAIRALLAAFVVAYLEIVALGLVLSIGGHLTLGWLGVATVAVAIGAVALDRARRPEPTGVRRAWSTGVALVRGDQLLLVLCVLTASILAYDLALAVLTPPAEGDALAYHISRAAYWLQLHGVQVVPGNTDARIDGSPPGAELVAAFTMLVSHGIRFVGLVQWLSLVATCVAILGLGRRLGIERRPALFAALLFPTASIVLLQGPTALNDIVVAAFAAIALWFLLGDTRLELAVAGAAMVCLSLTKVTFVLSIPVLLLAIVAIRGVRRGLAPIAVVIIGAMPALAWAALGPKTPGSKTIGGVETAFTSTHHNRISALPARLWRMSTEAFEIPGGAHRDGLVFVVVGVITAVVLAAVPVGRRARIVVPLAVAATVLFAPFASFTWRVYRKFWDLLGNDWAELIDVNRPLGRADTAYAWYGPVAVVLVVVSTITLLCRRGERRLAIVAAAPVVSLVTLAIVMTYPPTAGRYVMGGVAVSAGTWGFVLARRTLALWAVPAAAAIALLAVVHFDERPLGVRLLEGPAPRSVWVRSYADGIGFQRGSPSLIRFTDRVIPPTARLGLSNHLMATPFFGRGLTRTVLPLDSLAAAERADVDWAILPVEVARCRDGWLRIGVFPVEKGFAVVKRSPGARCRLESG